MTDAPGADAPLDDLSRLGQALQPEYYAPGADALRAVEAKIRRLHYYGDPPDTRLQADVDAEVADILDDVRALVAAAAQREREAVARQVLRYGGGFLPHPLVKNLSTVIHYEAAEALAHAIRQRGEAPR